ncbi:transglutaminase superfamily protein [Sinobacterium caligoides]|uniref:Transglutaminase superfamily protein n=2 Tax=Sinobacterium caligoides TaxID=933926 RepID=A0A3N2E067_9GAMM|nr:transglutaminase superfamily protein [Sinobacterium caligoides]
MIVAVVSSVVVVAGLAFWLLQGGVDRSVVKSPQDVGAKLLPQQVKAVDKLLHYSFMIKNRSAQLIEQGEFTVFAPVANADAQRINAIQASSPYLLSGDELGNQLLSFSLHDFPVTGMQRIDVAVKLHRSAGRAEQAPDEKYLQAERYIELEDPALQARAKSFAGLAESEKVATIYRWVREHMVDSGYVKRNRGASYALKHASGDCTEYVYLMTALLRLNNIPARPVGGFVAPGDVSILRAGDFHNWLEYYQDGRWHIADPQGGVLNKNDTDYIAFQYLSESNDISKGFSQRFLAIDQRLSVRMK